MLSARHAFAALCTLLVAAAACDALPTGANDRGTVAASAPPAGGPSFYTNATVICSTQTVPSGYVILSAGSSVSCPYYSGTGNNTYTVALPGTQEVVCSVSPIPGNYVIVAAGSKVTCPYYSGTGNNTYTIKVPGYQETVCSVSNVPSGYAIVGYGSSVTCPYYSGTGNNTKIIRRV